MWASRHTVSSGPRVYCVQRRRWPGPSTTIFPSVSLFSRSEVKGSQSSGVKRRGICHRKREYLALSRVWKSLWSIIFQNLSFLLEPFVVKRHVWSVALLQQALCFSGSASADSNNPRLNTVWSTELGLSDTEPTDTKGQLYQGDNSWWISSEPRTNNLCFRNNILSEEHWVR